MIPVNEPWLGGNELAYVTRAIESGWISSAGEYLDAFESAWARYCGRAHGIAVTNGTAALELSIRGLKLGPGDEVILPTFTIISCAQAVVAAGATPVLVDADPVTWGPDVDAIAARVTERTRAIMPVHIYGHPAAMGEIVRLADKHGVALIEDAAQAHGAEVLVGEAWRRCGSFGELSTFSFYANKIVTTGEGGMVVTDDDALAARLRSLRNLCFKPERRFHHDELGANERFTNVQAAIGLAQVEQIDEALVRKRKMAARYDQGLRDIDSLQLHGVQPWARSVHWMYGVVLRDDRSAEDVRAQLRARGVDTRGFFIGMHAQPALRDRGLFADNETFPVCERLTDKGFYLPSGLTLTDEQLDEVIAAVREVCT